MLHDSSAVCHMYNWYQSITQSFIHTRVWIYVQYTHSTSPWESRPLLTWRPPAVTRVVLFSPRLLVNCPLVPHCSPLFPASLPSGFSPNPNVLLIRTHPNPFPSVANSTYFSCYYLDTFWQFSKDLSHNSVKFNSVLFGSILINKKPRSLKNTANSKVAIIVNHNTLGKYEYTYINLSILA